RAGEPGPSELFQQIRDATLAGERDASLLDVSAGLTLLQLEETSRTDADYPYEFCHVRFRGDKKRITFGFSAARERGLVLTPGNSERGWPRVSSLVDPPPPAGL
ncbi:MAG: UTRA domain-containing protein, partial [Chloroflexota bacterium]